jgi:hypothetical protein
MSAMTMDMSIADCHNRCVVSFENLINALKYPVRDFGAQLSLPSIEEQYGRFKVWRGNVGAQHNPSRSISLDYRLRDSKFYRNKITGHLRSLSDTLDSCKFL